MTFNFKFRASRLQSTYITPVNFTVSVDIVIPDEKTKTKEQLEKDSFTSLQKISFLFENILDNVIIADVLNLEDLEVCNSLSNDVLFCPGSASDDIIARLLHAKVTALSTNVFTVGKMVVSADDTQYSFTLQPMANDNILPKTTAEYLDGVTLQHNIPWWNRNDGFIYEIIMPVNEESSEIEDELPIDPFIQFDKFIDEFMEESSVNTNPIPAKLVQVEKWKPKTV
jgi:hypothetical protein